MLRIGSKIQLSASDLVGHLNCRNPIQSDLAVAKGALGQAEGLQSIPGRAALFRCIAQIAKQSPFPTMIAEARIDSQSRFRFTAGAGSS
jgi:hypothetical protein